MKAAAAPGPEGPEFPAEDRPLEPDGWWSSGRTRVGRGFRRGMGFVIETIDATSPELTPISPMPLLGYRME